MKRRTIQGPPGVFPNVNIPHQLRRRPPGSAGRYRGPNLLVDGDCEAVGVAAWLATNATLSKQVVSPYEGLQVLRVAPSGSSNARAYQNVMTIGETYRITGVARSKAAAANFPSVSLDAIAGWVWTGVASSTWQFFDVTFLATAALIGFHSRGSLADYVEFDALYLSLES